MAGRPRRPHVSGAEGALSSGRARRSLWRQRVGLVLRFQAPVLAAIGAAMLLPVLQASWDARGLPPWNEARGFVLPALLSAGLALVLALKLPPPPGRLTPTEAFLVTSGAWLGAALLAALPFMVDIDMAFVDALHESVSGLTTAGTTLLTGLDTLPRSILLWRSLTQWLGGMGILLIVLLVGRAQGNHAYALLSAEGVKVDSGRLSLNFKQAALRFIQIYLGLTLAQVLITWLLGMPLYDAVSHAMTTVSTGGYSPHDESIAFYRNRPSTYPHYLAMEWVIIAFMLAGGINFYVLYRLARGQAAALWDGLEMRLLWLVVGGASLVVGIDAWLQGDGSLADWLQRAVFEVVSMVSTTGYETTATGSFPHLSKVVFLSLMVVGGCAGSTAGGIKLIRLGILAKLMGHEARQLRATPHRLSVPTADGRPIEDAAFRQAVFMLMLWLAYLLLGGLVITELAPDLGLDEAFSTVFTAIGVFGPSFAPVARVIALPVLAKAIFILGMLAGRLEILPLLVFLNPRAWTR